MKILEGPLEFMEKFGANTAIILAVLGIGAAIMAISIMDIKLGGSLRYMFMSAPLWLPFITFFLFFEYWLYYVRKKFDMEQGRTTIEIKLPQEILKSPEAMELVLLQMHQGAAPDNHLQTYIDGKHPPRYGLEIVSRGGDIRFYINTPRKKFKNIIETQLYAQYPGIEVTELDVDYTAEVVWDPERFQCFSIHMGLKKADAYPIKTYIEYGLQTLPKEEEKIDPITSMLEALGSIGPGEHIWMQVLIDANKELTFKEGALRLTPDWKDGAKKEIKKILEAAAKRAGAESTSMMLLTETEKDTIKAIERSLGKNAYNVVIRSMYIAENAHFNPGERIGAMITAWRGYDDLNRNSIGVRWRTDVNWPWWQDPSGSVRLGYKKQELDEYKRRAYTNHSDADTPKVMTTEELATIFHLPGRVATTPSLGRIPSKRAEAPSNLPIGTRL